MNAVQGALKQFGTKEIGAVAAAVLSLGVLSFIVAKNTILAPADPGSASRQRTLIDSVTGKVYEKFRIKEGVSVPFANPDTGKNTLYPAEACYWTKDGKAKITPTYVLMNEAVGKPGPTLCPDCGRKVSFHNPQPPNDLMIKAYEAAAKSGK